MRNTVEMAGGDIHMVTVSQMIYFQGFAIRPGGGIELITEVIKEELNPHMRLSVLVCKTSYWNTFSL